MTDKYKIRENEVAYFVTLTTEGWVDLFTRKNQKLAIVNSLKNCQNKKGLEIYGWLVYLSKVPLTGFNSLEYNLLNFCHVLRIYY